LNRMVEPKTWLCSAMILASGDNEEQR
jgi:hypothetical protein